MANNRQIDSVPFRSQSLLSGGKFEREAGVSLDNNALRWGTVTKVDFTNGLVQYRPLVRDTARNNPMSLTESSYAKLPVDFFGKTLDGQFFGSTTLIQTGNLVLLGNVGGDKNSAVVLGVYPPLRDVDYAKLSGVPEGLNDDSNPTAQDLLWQSKRIYPSQQLEYISGDGDYLRTLGGETFLQVTDSDFGELLSRDYVPYTNSAITSDGDTGEAIKPITKDAPAIVFAHRDNSEFSDDNHDTRLIIDKQGQVDLKVTGSTLSNITTGLNLSEEGVTNIHSEYADQTGNPISGSILQVLPQGIILNINDSDGVNTSVRLTSESFSMNGNNLLTYQDLNSLNQFKDSAQSDIRTLYKTTDALADLIVTDRNNNNEANMELRGLIKGLSDIIDKQAETITQMQKDIDTLKNK